MNNPTTFIDTHCHLDMNAYATDFNDVLERSTNSGVKQVITIGIDLKSSKRAIELAQQHDMLFATVGVHPHDVDSICDATYDQLTGLVENNKKHIVGLGEIGLDFFKNYSDVASQRKHFKKQLQLAKELQLPVIIHDRDAHDDTLNILKEIGPFPQGGVLHCFSGDLTFAKKILDLGFHISIPGIVTFKNAHELQDVAAHIPLDKMLLETDGPFLSPLPYRGKRNEPSYIPHIAKKIAELRNIEMSEVAKLTTKNARELFHLPSIN